MTRLHLLFHGRFPSEKAASLFAAKSAETFAANASATGSTSPSGGERLEVVVVVPKRKGAVKQDPFSYYGVEKNFRVIYLPTLDLFEDRFFRSAGSVRGARLAFWISFITFSISCFFYALIKGASKDIFYSNETLPLFFISFVRPNTFYEMHDFPESKRGLFGWFLDRMRWVLIHNKWKLEEAKKLFPEVSPNKYFYEPNAVDLKVFDTPTTKQEARKRLSLPLEKKIAVYTGHLYGWKGVDMLAQAADLLPPEWLVIFVGGTDSDIQNFKEKYAAAKNILIAGHKNHAEMPLWQKAADVLVLPNTAKEKISAYYTSPMKLFEYMASKRPIVASDIPSLHDILDDKAALFVAPDDPAALANGMKKIASDSESDSGAAALMAANAFDAVLSHTWDKRAERILAFIGVNKK